MATELAKAYVQIIPSASGIQGMLDKELSGETAAAGQRAGRGFVGTLKKVILAAGVGKLVGDSLAQGGALQQSLGGIETLFKDSADTVKAHAARAFETTGLSANAYMEAVTGFSASLLQGLGGDTETAAYVADMAMQDMADNANKMGTDMQSIQNAYQGFAKQNYTMLDNLKLGYGGTKEEMERLLADAQKITGVTYDISSLSDVYNAIHVIQGGVDELNGGLGDASKGLGITGTTANEAAATLTGSFAAMKAAAQNVLGNLSLGEDVGPSMQALGETVTTYLVGNLLPMVGNILSGLPTVLSTALSQGIPLLLTQASEWAVSFGTGLLAALPQLIQSAGAMLEGLCTAFAAGLPQFLSQGTALLQQLIRGISDTLPQLAEMALTVVTRLVNTLLENLPQLLESGGQLLRELVEGIYGALPHIVASAGEAISSMVRGLIQNFPRILSAGFDLLISLVAGIGNAMPNLLDAALGLVGDVWDIITKTDWLQLGADIIRGLINGIGSMAGALWDAAKHVARSALESIKTFFGIHSPSRVMQQQVGRFLPEGVAVGITENTASVTRAMRRLAEQTTGTLQAGLAASPAAPQTPAAAAPGAVHITIHGARYTDERSLAEAVAQEIQFMTERKRAAYGTA